MKMPITKQTVLSLAVAASLACVGGFAFAADGGTYDGSTYTFDSKTDTGTIPQYIFSNASGSEHLPGETTTITITGSYTGSTSDPADLSSTLWGVNINGLDGYSGTSKINFTLSNFYTTGSVGGLYVNPLGSSVTVGDVTVGMYSSLLGTESQSTSYTRLFGVEGVFTTDNSYLTVGDIGVTIDNTEILSTPYGVYASFGSADNPANGSTFTTGTVSVNILNGSTLDEQIDGVRLYSVYGENAAFNVEEINVNVSDSTVKGAIFGARVTYVYATGATFTIGDINITMEGDTTEANVFGFRLGDRVNNALTTEIGNISLEIKGGTDSGTFTGYHSNALTAASVTTIESVYIEVSDVEESGTSAEIRGVYKRDAGSLTIGDETTADAVKIVASNTADSNILGIHSESGTTTVTGDVSITANGVTDNNIHGVYIAGGDLTLNGNIILTLTDLNMPKTAETEENIEGFRFGGTGEATLGGDITITAIANQNISGDGFDHNIFGAAITYDSTGKVEQTGNITITIGGDNADLKLAGTIYGLVDATGNNSYTLTGTTKLVFGTSDAPFVSNESSSALTATFANFKEVVISDGSSLFIDYGLQDGTLTADADIFGDNNPANYVTDIHSEGGTLTLSADDNKLTIESGGQAYIDKLVNVGTVADEGDLTITRGSNSGTISGDNGLLVLGTPTDTSETFVSTGTIDIPTFILGKDATLDEQEGTVTVKTKADLTAAGYMAVGATATAELNVSGDINAQVSVLGKMAIGTPDSFAWTDDALKAAGITNTDSNILALKSLVTTGNTGYITVGNGVSVLSASDTPGLNFGSDSVLLIDAGLLTKDDLSSSAFTTSASDATITVDSGGTVVLYGYVGKGRYNITSGYDYGTDISGWYKPTEDDSDTYVKVVDPSGITWNYYRESDEQDGKKYVFIELTSHESITDELPDVNIPNIVDDDINDCKDGDYICGIIRDSDLTDDQKTEIINSSSTLLFDGGVTAVARDGAGTAIDHLYNHLTMDSDTFDKDAKLWQYEESENIWIDVMGNWSKAKSLFKATGLSSYGYRSHSYGFITGWDHKFADRPFVLGVAFSFDKGNLKSRGRVDPTKNLYKDYGIHIFGNYSENEHLNLIGSLHWLHNNSGVTQSTGVSEFSRASASMHTNTYAAGLRAETMIKAGDINVIPHVEARYLYGKTKGFDTKVNGNKVWRTKADGTHSVQIPFGVAFRTDKKFENGWNIRPNLDLEAIPQIGNTKQKTVVSDFNGVSDVIVGQFAGKWAGQARVGFQADKKNATLGAHYSFLGGNKGRAGHTFMVQGRVRF